VQQVGPDATAGDLNVLVTNRNGEPQSGVNVDVADATGAVAASVTTDANGFAPFTGLNEGAYTVSAAVTIAGFDFRASGTTAVIDAETSLLQLTVARRLDSIAETKIWETESDRAPQQQMEEQFQEWLLVPGWSDSDTLPGGAVAAGRFEIAVWDSAGSVSPPDTTILAGPNEELMIASDGLRYGKMRYQGHAIDHFEVRDFQTDTLQWEQVGQDSLGYYHYMIGPGVETVVGKSAEGHPGTLASGGSLVLYDQDSSEKGSVECQTPSYVRFSRDGSAMLARCRGDALKLINTADGSVLVSLKGHYRDFVTDDRGTYLAAVPVRGPTFLAIWSPDTSLTVDLSRTITEVAIMPGIPGLRPLHIGDGIVVAAVQDSVYWIDPPAPSRPALYPRVAGSVRWRYGVTGTSPKVVSMGVGVRGHVFLGILLDSDYQGAVHPAAIEVLRRGSLLHRVEFEVRNPAGRVPIVSLDPNSQRLLVRDHETVWSIDLEDLP
jgi:hypothetical protein